jgi:sugar lactone lactonase YvrE
VAAPMMAGFFAQENAYLLAIGSKCGSGGTSACAPLGNANYAMYQEGQRKNAGRSPFYDIVSGCNSNDITALNKLTAFCAKAGYDQVTGWGSANMLQLAWAINWEVIPATGVPYVTFTGNLPATNKWYNTNQTVNWKINDYVPKGGTPGTGIAGETQGWDSLPAEPSSEAHGGSGNMFYSGPQFPNGASGCLAFEPNGCSGGVSQGCHTVYVRGWNNQGLSTAGLAGYPETYGPLCYDTVAPTISVANSSPAAASGWYTQAVSVTLTAADPGGSNASGVAAVYYGVNNASCSTGNTGACSTYGSAIPINTQGTMTINAFAEDKAGNFSTVSSDVVKIDTTPPVTKAGLSGTLVSGVYQSAVTVVLTASDIVSGVQTTYYSLNGGANVTYGGSFKISTAGSQTLKYWSVDVAGNTEAANSITLTIESPTTTTLSASPNPSVSGQTVTLTATVAATLSGALTGTVTFKNGSATLGSGTVTAGTASYSTSALAVGTHSLTAVYGGNANHLASTSSAVTDTVNPVTTTSRVVYIPDYYGKLLQVRAGTGTATAITINLPSCNPNSVAVNSNKAYVVCNSDSGNPDKILVYNAATIRAAAAGTLTISPLQTITSNQFDSLIGIAFDASNNLWVASYSNNQIDEITAASLATATPTVAGNPLVNSPNQPIALAFDTNGSLWVTGQYGNGILVNFPSSQLNQGTNAMPDYCLATTNLTGCQYVSGVFLNPEGLALFNGDVWVSNNSTGSSGTIPGRELVDIKYSGGSASQTGTVTVHATYGKSGVAADSPLVCPGGLFAGSVHLWVNDESYGESNPKCGANGDVASKTGGVFDFTTSQLGSEPTSASGVLAWSNITGRPGFGGIFVENDK